MTEIATASHGLAAFVGTGDGNDADITLTIRSDLGHINLRGESGDTTFVAAAEKALGQTLPMKPNTICSSTRDIFWLGPNEWLILANTNEIPTIVATLHADLADIHAAVNVVSGGQIALSLSGNHVRDVLVKGCTIDFHPRQFTNGMCVQSGLARTNVLIAAPDDDEFMLIVRRSFSDYLLQWLSDAATEFGFHIEES